LKHETNEAALKEKVGCTCLWD